MELERLLRSQGFGSRPECRALICNGRVRINGVLSSDPYADINPEGLDFSIDGEQWTFRKFAYLVLNKPGNFECSQKPKYHPSVYSLLPRPLLTRGVQSVGRLDEDTTGLLIFSDDGQFIHTYTSPKKKIPKVYEVLLKHPAGADMVDALLNGVILNDEVLPIAATHCVINSEHLLTLSVTEGKYHMVKRMIAAAGNRVEGLRRISIGGLTLPPDLPVGKWSWLSADDLKRLAQIEVS